MGFILMIIVAAIVGWVADLIVPGDLPFGIIGSIIAGIIGAFIGSALLGNFGPQIGGIALIPAIIGAIIFAFLLRFLLGFMGQRR
ncbi:MAG: GlsB/YeaQ/YmgE family stress response membrane protein [Chloroflexota bacterium]|nr:GlsB/YeaQ/YmgE family stress response membrane protein [Chloroflexota bacterium]